MQDCAVKQTAETWIGSQHASINVLSEMAHRWQLYQHSAWTHVRELLPQAVHCRHHTGSCSVHYSQSARVVDARSPQHAGP